MRGRSIDALSLTRIIPRTIDRFARPEWIERDPCQAMEDGMRPRGFGVLAAVACAAGVLTAQEREDRTLLTQDQMTAIINEASGERAMHHVLELVGYQRVRLPVEYEGNFRESEVMARFAKEYG